MLSSRVRPLLVLVSGKPGSGKTILARLLADSLALPLVSRDAFKNGLAETLGVSDHAGMTTATLTSVDVFYGVTLYLLQAGVSLIAEQSFRRGLDERHILRLMTQAGMVRVHCQTSNEAAQRRFVAREQPQRSDRYWMQGAGNIIVQMEQSTFDWAVFEPLDVDVPLLSVDTTHRYQPDLESIAAFCRTAVLDR